MQLEWVAPPECPPRTEVLSRVKALAGEHAAARKLEVRARVVRVDTRRWRLELVIGEQTAEPRVVESDECSKLANATALIVSLDLQSRERLEREETSPRAPDAPKQRPPDAKPELAPPGRSVASPEPERSRPPSPPKPTPHLLIGTRIVGDLGSLPAPGIGVGFSGAVVYRSLRAELVGTLWGRSRATVDGQRDAGATTTLRTVTLRGCWRTLAAPFALDACTGLEAGRLDAVGFGISRPSTSTGSWFAVVLGPTVRHRISPRLGLNAGLEVGFPFNVPEAVIEGIGRIYAPSPIFGRLAIGLETAIF